ncbi:hypothetical protein [Actinoalloteichus caeruleus]|uniref:hypothetical protein n=1 Tax=Actinoalloteichus cyanogriseus TaxID=2893586 RepID=UPI003BB8DF61
MSDTEDVPAGRALGLARALAAGRFGLGPGVALRGSAFLGRYALEQVLNQLWVRADLPLRTDGRPTTRSRLLVLGELHPEIATPMSRAWQGLSRACHLHAYELTPTVGEIRYLLGLVEEVLVSTRMPSAHDKPGREVPGTGEAVPRVAVAARRGERTA